MNAANLAQTDNKLLHRKHAEEFLDEDAFQFCATQHDSLTEADIDALFSMGYDCSRSQEQPLPAPDASANVEQGTQRAPPKHYRRPATPTFAICRRASPECGAKKKTEDTKYCSKV